MFFICLKQQHRTYVSWNWQSWRRSGSQQVRLTHYNSCCDFFQFHHCEFLRWTIKNNSRVCLETHAVLSEAGWPYKFKGAITPFAIFFRITWILKITSFFYIRLNIKTLKLFPVVYCNEWQRSCHGHRRKLGQRFQVFFFAYKNHKKVVSASW